MWAFKYKRKLTTSYFQWYWLFVWSWVRGEELCRSRSQSETIYFEWKILSFKLNGQQKLNVQPVLQHWCKTSWIAMLRVSPHTFKPVNNLICYKTGLMWVIKRATLLFNSFCSTIARKVACFLLPVLRTYSSFLWLVCYAKKANTTL